MNHLARSKHYIDILKKARDKDKITLLKSMPKYVLHDIVEILSNIVDENCTCSARHKSTSRKCEKKIVDLIDQKSNAGRQSVMYKQRGGGVFLALILPAITAAISGLLASR